MFFFLFGYIVDVDYNITCHLCNSQQCYFEGITDFDASRFYWYYAFALIGIGNTKEALPLLEHCQKLCLQVEGDNSWIGARAGHLYHCVTIYQDQSSEAEDFLWDLLQKIDDEYYPEMDSSSGFVGAFTRSVLLKYNMERQTLRHYYSEIMRFRDYCYEHDAEAVTARLSIPTPGFVLTRARQWESHPCFSALTLWKNSTYNANQTGT